MGSLDVKRYPRLGVETRAWMSNVLHGSTTYAKVQYIRNSRGQQSVFGLLSRKEPLIRLGFRSEGTRKA
jgi:hypothetical protein